MALGALAVPGALRAQSQGKIWRVGFLGRRIPKLTDAFVRGMRELGYVEARNLAMEWRYTEGNSGRLPQEAEELVRLKVDVLVGGGSPAISAFRNATATIPIVMASASDPVGSGFIASLSRPGGNITGLSNLLGDLSAKQLDFLLSIMPRLSRLAVLANPLNSSNAMALDHVRSAARKAGIQVLAAHASTDGEIKAAFSTMTRENADAVIVLSDGFLFQRFRQIAELAALHRIPSVSALREHVESGGLMSYGPNVAEQFRRAATYVDRIFKGARPGDLPVEQPTIFEFLINDSAAKALGLVVPEALLMRADEVIR